MKTLILIGLVTLAGCTQMPRSPIVNSTVAIASQYNFRGVPQNEHGVIQPQVDIQFEETGDLGFVFSAWGNIDLSDDTGSAALPNGNGGRLSEIDFTALVTRSLGSVDLAMGMISYNFPNSSAGSTSELHTAASLPWLGFSVGIAGYYDFDSVDGLYVAGALSRSQTILTGLRADLGLTLGLSEANHSRVYYGLEEAGFADLTVSGSISCSLRPFTTISVSVSGARLLRNELRRSLEATGIQEGSIWAVVGLHWGI